MSYLLDTQVLLWWLADDSALSSNARKVIASGSNLVCVSAVTIWEIVIKQALGKLEIPQEFREIIGEQGFEALPVTWDHAFEVANLPDHHRDPIDRVLIAQSRVEKMTLISQDTIVRRYDVRVLEA